MNPELFDSPVARRFHELPNGVPGHFTMDEVKRGQRIHEAEAGRHIAELHVLDLIGEAFALHPDAEDAGEALQLAGLEEEYERRATAVPEADEVGMKWLIGECERSIAAGTFIVIPASG